MVKLNLPFCNVPHFDEFSGFAVLHWWELEWLTFFEV
jgi:hypothetical protein